jgi:glutamyl-tRNA reductase
LLSELKNHPLITESFVLSTCNRIEVYLKRADSSVDSSFVISLIAKIKKINFDFDPASYVYAYEDAQALDHLLRVACGLESLVLGEKQILGQVKLAVERAREAGTLSRHFNILTNLAVRTGKKAQHETVISHGGSSISWAACEMAQKAAGNLQDRSVLVIGAGKMGEIALNHLHDMGVKKIFLMNRTGEKAEQLATRYNGIAASFWNIKEILGEVDICFCAVGAPHYILDREKIANIMEIRQGRKLVLIDISMPRNIDPEVRSLPGVHLSSIDDLHEVVDNSMKKRESALSEVEDIIRQKISEFNEKISKLQSSPNSDFFRAPRVSV